MSVFGTLMLAVVFGFLSHTLTGQGIYSARQVGQLFLDWKLFGRAPSVGSLVDLIIGVTMGVAPIGIVVALAGSDLEGWWLVILGVVAGMLAALAELRTA